MFKIYGVSSEKETTEIPEPKNTAEEPSRAVEVELKKDQDYDTDIGQIAVDVLDLPEAIVIIAPIAGVDPADVDIGLSRNILTIAGSREAPHLYKEAKRLLVEECFYGSFSRSIILPENLGFDEIHANVENNVITISIPKLTLLSKKVKIKK